MELIILTLHQCENQKEKNNCRKHSILQIIQDLIIPGKVILFSKISKESTSSVQANLHVTGSMGPGKLVCCMQSLSYLDMTHT